MSRNCRAQDRLAEHVGGHHVERPHLEAVLPQHQDPDRAVPCPGRRRRPGPRSCGSAWSAGRRRRRPARPARCRAGRSSASRRSSGMASSLSPITTTSDAGEADHQPVQLGPEERGDDAQRGDHQQQRPEQPGDLQGERVRLHVRRRPREVGLLPSSRPRAMASGREERALLLGAVPDAEHAEHDACVTPRPPVISREKLRVSCRRGHVVGGEGSRARAPAATATGHQAPWVAVGVERWQK